MKRIVSLLCAAALAVSIVPLSGSAAGNEPEPALIKPLVLESDAPAAVVTVDNSSYKRTHDITVEAKDADADGEAPYAYSGISSVGYVLQNQKGDTVYTLTKKNPIVPGEEKELPLVRAWTHSVTGLQKGNCGIYDGVLLDGAYVLTVTVTDYCGNRYAGDPYDLNFDNTAPAYTVIMEEGNENEGDFYYREDNCGIRLQVEDERLADGVSYTVEVGSREVTGTVDASGVIEIPAADVASNADGEKTVMVTLTDNAGNTNKLYKETDGIWGVKGSEDRSSCSFLLDKTPPVAQITYTAATEDHVYEDGTRIYYNSDIQGKIQITDKYGDTAVKLDEAKLFYQDTAQIAEAFGTGAGESVEKTFSWTADGEYYLSVYGTDRAGNPLTVEEHAPHAEGKMTQEGCEAAGSFTPRIHVIRDTKAPVYTFRVASADAQNQDRENGRYYFNKEFQAELTVTEEHYDPRRITLNRTYQAASDAEVPEKMDLRDGFSFRVQENAEKTFTDTVRAGDGIYRYLIRGTDKAGNALTPAAPQEDLAGSLAGADEDTEADLSVHVILDTTPPKILVKTKDTEGNFYRGELNGDGYSQESYPYRRQSGAEASVSVEDYTPASLSYSFASSNKDAANTNVKYKSSQKVKSPQKTAVFDGQQAIWLTVLKAEDKAGNTVFLGDGSKAISTYMYLDAEPPAYDAFAPNVNIKFSGNAAGTLPGGNTLYTGNVKAEVKISDPGKAVRSSGLYKVCYKIQVNGKDVTAENQASVTSKSGKAASGEITYGTSGYGALVEGNQRLVYEDEVSFVFDGEAFNYNDVRLTVWAEDNSGNQNGKISKGFGIDITKPVVRVRYNNNEVQNEKYFKEDRIAVIEVTERNFSEAQTKIHTQGDARIGDWSCTSGTGANGDDTVWRCSVTYSADGDYTFDVETKDLAGNVMEGAVDYGDSAAPREFTMDKTAPVIKITFDNNAVRNGKYYDAGRTAAIEITEHNFSGNDAKVTSTAAIAEGSVAIPGITGWGSNGDSNVTTVSFLSDGDYTLQVEYTDLAGNIAKTERVEEFTVDTTAPVIEITGVKDRSANKGEAAPSVVYHDINYAAGTASVTITGYKNRDGRNLKGSAREDAFGGSFICANIDEVPENDDVYICRGHVEDMAGNSSEAEIRFSVNRYGSNYILTDATEKLVQDYYTGVSPTVQVTEINVNTLEFQEITAALNGEILSLSEGEDYQVTHQGSEDTWKEYHYTVPAKYFREDGAYNLTIHSRDEAKNENSNRTTLVAEYAKPIDFVLDTTPPSVFISGAEEEGQYAEDSRIITILPEDNIGLSQMKVYLDEELKASFSEEEIAQGKGIITYEAQSKNQRQTLRVELLDKAGNQGESSVRFLLTTNLLVQYIHNTPLVAGSIAGLILLFILFGIWKRCTALPEIRE